MGDTEDALCPVNPSPTRPCNVFWEVSSSAAFDTATTFVGTITSLATTGLSNLATIAGRALARNAAVTLINSLHLLRATSLLRQGKPADALGHLVIAKDIEEAGAREAGAEGSRP